MNRLKTKMIPVKRQKFDGGRIISIAKCSECSTCEYMTCGNYAKIMEWSNYSVDEWFEFHFSEGNLNDWSYDVIEEFFTSCMNKFPQNLYWEYDDQTFKANWSIVFKSRGNNGVFRNAGSVSTTDFKATIKDANKEQANFIEKVAGALLRINELKLKRISDAGNGVQMDKIHCENCGSERISLSERKCKNCESEFSDKAVRDILDKVNEEHFNNKNTLAKQGGGKSWELKMNTLNKPN